MRLAHVLDAGTPRLALATAGGWAPTVGVSRLSELLAQSADPAATLAALVPGDRVVSEADAQVGPLLDRPGRIFCIGRNYVAHRDEFHNRPTEWPEVFLRQPNGVTGPYADVVRPAVTDRFDFEGELAVVIGRGGRYIPAASADEHVLGCCVANDFTAREWQHRGGQWTSGKNFDGTLPVGPALVTLDEVDFHDLALSTVVSGVQMQSARTSQFIWSVAEQIEFISSWTALVPGDLIITGTPGGVGIARTPPRVLEAGDVVEVTIEGLGRIANHIVADPGSPAGDHWQQIAGESKVGRG
jgi:2-keto-4-pentenoate hydratase/2-oxohepta-3-ene-1,7-dioic acid hydratase in catechol pathway